MIIQAELRRKQSEYEGEACSVDKVIELPAQRFKQFSRALLADYDFIAENKNAIRHDDDARHCLLILDAEGKDGFLVDPQGYNYARYSAFVPNARSLLTPDMGIDRSYLSPTEPWRNENQDEMLRMTLRVDGKPDYTLILPADEEYLDAVKNYLDKRGLYTMGQSYRGNIEGSDPKHSFHYLGGDDTLYVFEAPIDLLSYISPFSRRGGRSITMWPAAGHPPSPCWKCCGSSPSSGRCISAWTMTLPVMLPVSAWRSCWRSVVSPQSGSYRSKKDWNDDLKAEQENKMERSELCQTFC